MSESIQELSGAIEKAGRGLVLFVTGAGVSLASGIPTFRGTDPGAIWKRDVLELGTRAYFERDPVGSWSWYLSRFDKVLEAEPNRAHDAIAALETWQKARRGQFLTITQNVDILHERAGSRELVKVHGSADRVRCSREGCRNGSPYGSLPRADFDMAPFLAEPTRENLPRCPKCEAILRQHVLWFDEYYQEHEDYQWRRVQEASLTAHVVIFVGTSFSVGVTEMILQYAAAVGVPVFSIDPGAKKPYHSSIQILPDKAEELLPAVCGELGAKLS